MLESKQPSDERTVEDTDVIKTHSDKCTSKRDSKSSPPVKQESQSSDASYDDVALHAPPVDGGWGWLVVMASFLIHCIADGCAFSFGVLYVELLEYFGESKAKTAWVGSLFVSVPLITGPVASAITNKYGCRNSTIVGGIIAGAGYALSAFANSIETLCVTLGVIAGFGLSLVYVPAICVVAFYFEKRRSFATGLAVAGSGIGTFMFAPLTEHLIRVYSWRGALVILSGVMLNIIVCGAVFRPLLPANANNKSQQGSCEASPKRQNSLRNFDSVVTKEEIRMGPFVCDKAVTHSLLSFPTYTPNESLGGTPPLARIQESGTPQHHASTLPESESLLVHSHSISNGRSLQRNGASHVGSGLHKTVANRGLLDEENGLPANGSASEPSWKSSKPKVKKAAQTYTDPLVHFPLARKDIFYRGSLLSHSNQRSPHKAASCPDIFVHADIESSANAQHSSLCRRVRFSHEFKHIMKEMLDISILRSFVFVYFCISNMFLYIAYDTPYIYIPDQALVLGISQEAASFLVSIIGIVSTFGQVIIGFVGDRPVVNTLHLYSALTAVAGGCTMFVPILRKYETLAFYCGAYGFFISANYALTTIILVKLVGMNKLTNAYGLIMLSEGIANLMGPPLAGWLYDITGNYDATFILSGAFIVVAGLMLFAIPLFQQYCCGMKTSRASSSAPNDTTACQPAPNLSHITTQDATADASIDSV